MSVGGEERSSCDLIPPLLPRGMHVWINVRCDLAELDATHVWLWSNQIQYIRVSRSQKVSGNCPGERRCCSPEMEVYRSEPAPSSLALAGTFHGFTWSYPDIRLDQRATYSVLLDPTSADVTLSNIGDQHDPSRNASLSLGSNLQFPLPICCLPCGLELP